MKISGDLRDLSEVRGSPKTVSAAPKRPEEELRGYLHMISVSNKGIRQITKTRFELKKLVMDTFFDFFVEF